MDALDMHGGLGGVMALTTGFSLDPLRVADAGGHLNVVSDRGYADFGFAVTYDRYRLYLNMDAPFVSEGGSGIASGHAFSGPSLALPNSPDTLSDARIGFDARIVGDSGSRFRLGAGAQLFIPNGERADYISDGTYRAMLRVLAAGDVGMLTYAAQLGVHIRPLDDGPTPGSPRGSELLFGVASGVKLRLGGDGGGGGSAAFILGPEIFGATAFRSFFGATTTALEGLLSVRYEGTSEKGPPLRLKLGTGGGIDQEFGAPAWRAVFSIEVFGREPAPGHP
jgi:hypothetical protein